MQHYLGCNALLDSVSILQGFHIIRKLLAAKMTVNAVHVFMFMACMIGLIHVKGIHGQSNSEGKKQICEPGTRTKVDCNTCTCILDGTALGCTRMACPKAPEDVLNVDTSVNIPHGTDSPKPKICEPGTIRELACNSCRCGPDATSEQCTNICPGSIRLRHDSRSQLPAK